MTSAYIVPVKKRGLGREVITALQQSWPGEHDRQSDLIIRWGQDTDFPPGKVVVVFDCGYFVREHECGSNRHVRLSINEYHPTNLPKADGRRWRSLGVQMQQWHDPNGHILLVGRGRKSRIKQGDMQMRWEHAQAELIRKRFPGRRVVYRPKKMPHERIHGLETNGQATIPELLKGCALVVTHSSNVGNEAIAHGIPVVAEGGPMADICGNVVKPLSPPSLETQCDYLHRLAWWQWSLREIRNGAIWPWLLQQVEKSRHA